MIKDDIKQILGRRISGIGVHDKSRPGDCEQVFLFSDDGTYFEVFGGSARELGCTRGVFRGTIEECEQLMEVVGVSVGSLASESKSLADGFHSSFPPSSWLVTPCKT